MTRRLVVIALLTATAGLASCDRNSGPTTEAPATKVDAGSSAGVPEEAAEAAHAPSAPSSTALPDGEAIKGAPAFAVVYPGGVLETTPLTPVAEGGAGGGIVFTSDASPDDIVDFYRRKAEAAGLASIMSLSQGETRGYGASGSHGGAGLKVVAYPVEPGRTSVQVTWTGGQ